MPAVICLAMSTAWRGRQLSVAATPQPPGCRCPVRSSCPHTASLYVELEQFDHRAPLCDASLRFPVVPPSGLPELRWRPIVHGHMIIVHGGILASACTGEPGRPWNDLNRLNRIISAYMYGLCEFDVGFREWRQAYTLLARLLSVPASAQGACCFLPLAAAEPPTPLPCCLPTQSRTSGASLAALGWHL